MFKSIILKLFKSQPRPFDDPSGSLAQIIVPKSAVAVVASEPHELIQAVVNYVNFMMSHGKYTRDEIPDVAIQAYHTDYYLAQVNNGGHAQFVGNAADNLLYILDDVDAGLGHSGARAHHDLFRKMAAWARANPDEAQEQTGFTGGIAPELAALDTPFFDLEKDTPLTPYLARWIAASPRLQPVKDAQIQSVLMQTAKLNPHLAQRTTGASIARIDHWLSDPLHLSLGMTGGRCNPVAPVVAIGGGSYMPTPEGEQMCWLVQTVRGERFGVVDDSGATLLDYIAGTDLKPGIDIAGITLEDVQKFVPPKVGSCLAKVPRAEIEIAAATCKDTKAGAAVDLLLRKLPVPAVADFVSVRSAGPDNAGTIGASLFVVADGMTRAFSVIVDHQRATLLAEPSHDKLLSVTSAEVETHLASV